MNDPALIQLIHEALSFALGEDVPGPEALAGDANLSDLGVESVASLEVAGYIEDKLEIQFPDDELSSLATVGDVVALIHRHQHANHPL